MITKVHNNCYIPSHLNVMVICSLASKVAANVYTHCHRLQTGYIWASFLLHQVPVLKVHTCNCCVCAGAVRLGMGLCFVKLNNLEKAR